MSTDSENPSEFDEIALRRTRETQARFQTTLRRLGSPTELLRGLLGGVPLDIGALDVTWSGTGLSRPGTIVHLAWPRLDTRVGIGIENTISHVIVDHLLGFTRLPAEATRQVTPVEFGVLTFVAARALDRLDARPGPWGPWDLTIERIGPDTFHPRDLGPIVTIRFPIKMGGIQGSIRVWFAESLLMHDSIAPSAEAVTLWRAEAGAVTLTRGLGRLKPGAVLPIDNGSLKGTTASPQGPLRLVRERSFIDVQPVPETACARVFVTSPVRDAPGPKPTASTPTAPDLPVTLLVELGQVTLSAIRLTDLKEGEMIDLTRDTTEPVGLTLNGKLIARGALVQIDTELGVRVKSVLI